MSRPIYLTIRLLIWAVSFFICLLPTLLDIKTPSIDPRIFAVQANAKGLFRDLFFAIVPTSALAISTLIDFMINHFSSAHEDFRGTTIIALILNIIALGSGLVGFLLIPSNHKPLLAPQFSIYFLLLSYAVVLSLLTEAVMAVAIRSKR